MSCLDDLEAHALVAGTLSPEHLAATLAHVESCGECRDLIEALCEGGAPGRESRIGEIAGGGYRIDAVIADGGMGRVYRATDLARGGEVAVKVPHTKAPWAVRRFEREISITARLAHPAIARVHGAGTLADGTPFLAMQLVDGGSLQRAIDRASSRVQRLALVPHLVAAADAIAFAHDRGIVHRDLKPHDIVLGEQTVILDWGLAKDLADGTVEPARPSAAPPIEHRGIASRTTRPGDVFGTPAFMAPEQARGEPVDRRCDVFALGAILRHLLVGRLRGRAADAALDQAPAELAAICRRATTDAREPRHRDAGELAAELRAALERPPAIASPPRRWRWLRGER